MSQQDKATQPDLCPHKKPFYNCDVCEAVQPVAEPSGVCDGNMVNPRPPTFLEVNAIKFAKAEARAEKAEVGKREAMQLASDCLAAARVQGLQLVKQPISEHEDDFGDCFEFVNVRAEAAEARNKELEQTSTYERDSTAEKYPIPVVCAVILRDGEVLLERRATTGVEGLDRMWDVPGGKMERGETPKEAIKREIKEEQGLQVSVGPSLPIRTSTWVYHGKQRYWLLVPYVCSLMSGTPKLSNDLKWWPVDALPDQMLSADREMVADSNRADSLSLLLREVGETLTKQEWRKSGFIVAFICPACGFERPTHHKNCWLSALLTRLSTDTNTATKR